MNRIRAGALGALMAALPAGVAAQPGYPTTPPTLGPTAAFAFVARRE